ncbi:DEKNAAC103499 [Brettanomyces naardenensis]|uniref:DEKNAAC103499 n=1 Tax=Brettanomyces naardenensis TaxID=13370 RepID=A0A448YNZ5_BRENA|nr:DEKNAAC103499 [Brettanomyces naardenensis]
MILRSVRVGDPRAFQSYMDGHLRRHFPLSLPRYLTSLSNSVFSPTIYALSTTPGRSAIAVIRISGPASSYIYHRLTHSRTPPKPRYATVRKLYSPESNTLLDESLCLYFKGPHSYTGEDSMELQVHGGRAVVSSVMKAISSLHTEHMPIKYAERGQFSMRGFQNGRFDLTEAEGINELINAETEVQRVSALSSMKGETRELFHSWRKRILGNVALLTTVIDFGEDHDVDQVNILFDKVDSNIAKLEDEVIHYLEKTRRSQILMDGIRLTLLGPPNAGKSSLLNIMADDDKAIVSSIAGTTRDSIEIPMSIHGYKVVVGDTAGIRDSPNEIEREGIKRAKLRSVNADINLVMIPADLNDIDDAFLNHVSSIRNREHLIIINKGDLVNETERLDLLNKLSTKLNVGKDNFRFISCLTREGIDDLTDTLTSKFREITWTDSSEDPVVISKRAQDVLAKEVLQGFKDFRAYKKANDIVLATEGLKFSMEGIGRITGEAIGVEEILGTVFSQFCIGK